MAAVAATWGKAIARQAFNSIGIHCKNRTFRKCRVLLPGKLKKQRLFKELIEFD